MKAMSKVELLTYSKKAAAREREATLEVIECLRECDRRMLYVELGYGSLHEFAMKELLLSEASAGRRIAAMRLGRDVPEAMTALASGELSLSNAAKVQSFVYAERKAGREHNKAEIVAQVMGKSQTECERKLYEISPAALPQERERVVGSASRELTIVVSEEFYQKLQELKDKAGHSAPGFAELIETMADSSLAQVARTDEFKRAKPLTEAQLHSAAEQSEKLPSGTRVAWPALIKRAVFQLGGHRCQHTHGDGTRCSATTWLEIDHITPLARGGSNRLANLRLLCRNHNRLAAYREVGTRAA